MGSATMYGRPVVEDLQAAEQDVGLLDVDPGVLDEAPVGLSRRRACWRGCRR